MQTELKPKDRPIGRGVQGMHVVLHLNDGRKRVVDVIEAKVLIVSDRNGNPKPVVDYKGKRFRATRDANGRLQIVTRPPATRNEAVIDGVRPKRGLYIVNIEHRRVYGLIVRVSRTGNVIWQSPWGIQVETRAAMLINGPYRYATEVPKGYAVNIRGGYEVTNV